MKLTPEQQPFAQELNRHCMVVAIPGSGKSTAIVGKMHNIVVVPKSVIGVTFTREAAESLKRSAHKDMSRTQRHRCKVGTFHSLVIKALKQLADSPLAARKIMRSGEARIQREKALEACGVEPNDETLRWFEDAYTRVSDPFGLVEAQRLPASDKGKRKAVALAQKRREVVDLYEERLRAHGVFDLNRVLLTALEYVKRGHRLLVADHILVDEFQDVDEVQLQLILGLAQWSRIDVVGDDDQSIYRFRNALGYRAFQTFKVALRPKEMVFTVNFRCKQEILDWAGAVIKKNQLRITKELNPDRGPGGTVRQIVFDVDGAEHGTVTKLIQQALDRGAKTVAVIARNRKSLVDIQPALTGRVDFRRLACNSFWDENECSIALSVLRAIAEPDTHQIGLEHALHAYGTHGSELEVLRKLAAGRRVYMAFNEVQMHQAISTRTRLAMDWLEGLLDAVSFPIPPRDNVTIDAVIDSVVQELSAALTESGKFSNDWLRVICSRLIAAKETMTGLQGTLSQRLDVVDRARRSRSDAPVTLTTMHGSKGLQFDEVFIIRAAQSSIPGRKRTPEEVEEERRLLYVAMTRARNSLTISHARRYGASRYREAEYMTMLLHVNGSPSEEAGSDYAWLLRT